MTVAAVPALVLDFSRQPAPHPRMINPKMMLMCLIIPAIHCQKLDILAKQNAAILWIGWAGRQSGMFGRLSAGFEFLLKPPWVRRPPRPRKSLPFLLCWVMNTANIFTGSAL